MPTGSGRTPLLSPRAMSTALARIDAFLGGRTKASVTRVAEAEDPFAVLVSTIISLRTRDEVTDRVSPRLLAVAPDAAALARTPERRIAELIYPAGFYNTKARTLREIGQALLDRHDGRVPDDLDALLALKGVGRKTANLVVTLGFAKPGICVDTHVHRIANRLGFVRARAPDETEQELRARLPRRWWIPINDLLVVFGQRHCTPLSPRCSTCPVRDTCRRVGVGRSR
ncbi:MAG: endonuclease III [Labilithrix sp.]|nr:endonuclease III [Labilithrix sp.]